VSREPQRVDRPHMPAYGVAAADEGQGLLDWSWAAERLTTSHHYWLATTWPDGRPHVMPVWGAWLDDAVWCSTSLRSRKYANLARDPRCTVATDNAYEPVLVEGTATVLRDEPSRQRFLDATNSKYDTKYELDFFDPEVNAVITIAPLVAIGLDEADFTGTPTRWHF
jgi:PPOX class probable F420-dependent enzyme